MKKSLFSVLFMMCLATVTRSAELAIPSISSSETYRQTKLPAVQPRKGERVLLNFTAFITREKPIGWATILEIEINGRKISQLDPAGKPRLVNKEKTFVSHNGNEKRNNAWFRETRLLVFYGSGTGHPDRRAQLDENAWKYSLDITDLIRPGKPVFFKGINYLYRNNTILQIKEIELKVIPEQK